MDSKQSAFPAKKTNFDSNILINYTIWILKTSLDSLLFYLCPTNNLDIRLSKFDFKNVLYISIYIQAYIN